MHSSEPCAADRYRAIILVVGLANQHSWRDIDLYCAGPEYATTSSIAGVLSCARLPLVPIASEPLFFRVAALAL